MGHGYFTILDYGVIVDREAFHKSLWNTLTEEEKNNDSVVEVRKNGKVIISDDKIETFSTSTACKFTTTDSISLTTTLLP